MGRKRLVYQLWHLSSLRSSQDHHGPLVGPLEVGSLVYPLAFYRTKWEECLGREQPVGPLLHPSSFRSRQGHRGPLVGPLEVDSLVYPLASYHSGWEVYLVQKLLAGPLGLGECRGHEHFTFERDTLRFKTPQEYKYLESAYLMGADSAGSAIAQRTHVSRAEECIV